MTTKNKEITKRKTIKKSDKIFFIAIGILSLILIIGLTVVFKALNIRLIQISIIAIIAGVFYESKRLTEKWKTVLFMALGSFAFSLFSFLPGKHESIYNLENHIKYWPYSFILFFLILSITINEKKIIPKLTEGITLIQSIAIFYWVIDFGLINTSSLIIKLLLIVGLLFSLYTFLNAFTNIILSRTNRFILSLWSSLIMVLFAIDNIFRVYQNGQIEAAGNLTLGLYIGLQYFLLGVCSIYMVQNFFMLAGFLPSKNTFFNAEYFRDIKELKNQHITRYSEIQVSKFDALFCFVFIVTIFSLNYYFKLIPRNVAIWIVFVVTPYIIYIYNYIRKQIKNNR